MSDVAEAAEEFDEAFYLRANPDVQAAVQSGLFRSGRAHYLAFGRAENRAACPSEARITVLEVPELAYDGVAPPEALRHRVHGSRDLNSFQTIGKIVSGHIYSAIRPV